jgi:hypothetical protein
MRQIAKPDTHMLAHKLRLHGAQLATAALVKLSGGA